MLQNQKLTGTNCYNCLYISEREETVDASELNDQGGIDPKTEADMKKAQKADLITLPEGTKADATNKKFCYHEQIGMFVTVRMCCAYWDSKGVIRPWKKK